MDILVKCGLWLGAIHTELIYVPSLLMSNLVRTCGGFRYTYPTWLTKHTQSTVKCQYTLYFVSNGMLCFLNKQ